jgi:hypothetical protein
VEHALACPGSSRASGSAVNWRRYAEKDGTWERQWRWHRKAVRALWAPELHYVKRLKNYFITLSMPPGDRGILKSTTGKPEGPYVNGLANDGKLDGDIDAFFLRTTTARCTWFPAAAPITFRISKGTGGTVSSATIIRRLSGRNRPYRFGR